PAGGGSSVSGGNRKKGEGAPVVDCFTRSGRSYPAPPATAEYHAGHHHRVYKFVVSGSLVQQPKAQAYQLQACGEERGNPATAGRDHSAEREFIQEEHAAVGIES